MIAEFAVISVSQLQFAGGAAWAHFQYMFIKVPFEATVKCTLDEPSIPVDQIREVFQRMHSRMSGSKDRIEVADQVI